MILLALLDSEPVELFLLFLLGICLHSHPAPSKVVLMRVMSRLCTARPMCSFNLMGFQTILTPHLSHMTYHTVRSNFASSGVDGRAVCRGEREA